MSAGRMVPINMPTNAAATLPVNERFNDVPPLERRDDDNPSAKSMNKPDGFRLACISGRGRTSPPPPNTRNTTAEMDAAEMASGKRLRTTSRISAPCV